MQIDVKVQVANGWLGMDAGEWGTWAGAFATFAAAGIALWQALKLRADQIAAQKDKQRSVALLAYEEAVSAANRVLQWTEASSFTARTLFAEIEDLQALRPALADLPPRQLRRVQRLHTNMTALNRTTQLLIGEKSGLAHVYCLNGPDLAPAVLERPTFQVLGSPSEFKKLMLTVGMDAATVAIELAAICRSIPFNESLLVDEIHSRLSAKSKELLAATAEAAGKAPAA